MSYICTPIHVLCPLVRSALCIARVRVHLVPWKGVTAGRAEASWNRLADEHHFKPWREAFPLRSKSQGAHTPTHLPSLLSRFSSGQHGLSWKIVAGSSRTSTASRYSRSRSASPVRPALSETAPIFPPHALELVCASSEQSELNACKRWLLQPPQKKVNWVFWTATTSSHSFGLLDLDRERFKCHRGCFVAQAAAHSGQPSSSSGL